MRIDNQGTVVLFQPEGDFEYEWLVLSVDAEPYQWLGRNLTVDHRMAGDLAEACVSAGWVIDEV